MIEEARRLPPSMVAIGIAFISLFAVLSLGTIVAVVADDSPTVPKIEDLPLVAESEIVDSVSTCTESACDGYGVLVQSGHFDAGMLSATLADLWRTRGWAPVPCVDEGNTCFADEELRISVRTWDEIDPLIAPTLLAEVADRELDPSRLLYVHYYRCGVIFPCR